MISTLTLSPPSNTSPPTTSVSSELTLDDLLGLFASSFPFPNRQEVFSCQQEIQLRLNQGEKATAEMLFLLQQQGYSISHHPETIERFKTFPVKEHRELEQAIRAASSEGGLFVHAGMMYQPGAVSVRSLGGAARGSFEIDEVHQRQSTKKIMITETVASYVQQMIHHCSEEARWKGPITAVTVGCRKDIQTADLVHALTKRMPEQAWTFIEVADPYLCTHPKAEQPPSMINEHSTYQFLEHRFLTPPSPEFHGKAHLIFIYDVGFTSEYFPVLISQLRVWQAQDSCIVIINDTPESDGVVITNHEKLFKGRDVPQTANTGFVEEMKKHWYRTEMVRGESLLLFPFVTDQIKEAILNIRMGDYENPYFGFSKDFLTVKALMEFYAKSPLEATTLEGRSRYLEALEQVFNFYEGFFLKNAHQLIFACPGNSTSEFQKAFKKSIEGGIDFHTLLAFTQELLALDYYKAAEEVLTKALERINRHCESIWHQESATDGDLPDYDGFLKGIELLAEINLKRDCYPQAVGLLCYAKRIEERRGRVDSLLFAELNAKIDQIEIELLTQGKDLSVSAGGIAQTEADQTRLNNLRDETRIKLDQLRKQELREDLKALELQSINQEMTQKIKDYIANLVKECVEKLAQIGKTPPCEYAIVGLDSLAREEMTPFSPVKYTIMTENEQEQTIEYFTLLSTLLRQRIVKLGETPLSAFKGNGFYSFTDSITPQGFSIGDAVIHTPENLVRILPTTLRTISLIRSSTHGTSLVTAYQERVDAICTLPRIIRRTKKLLEEDLQTFSPYLEREISGKADQVTQDLCFVTRMFDRLADYYSLKSCSSWDRIEELFQQGRLTKEGAQDLKELVMLSQGIRLSIHFEHGQGLLNVEDIDNHDEEISLLYLRFVPFCQAMERFHQLMILGKDPTEALQQERFFTDTSYSQGLIAYRMMDYFRANLALKKETDRTSKSLELSGDVKHLLGKYRSAIKRYQEALALVEDSPMKQGRLYKKLGGALKMLAKVQPDESGANAAFSKAEEILKGALVQKTLILSDVHGGVSSSSSTDSYADLENTKELKNEITALQKLLEEVYRDHAYFHIFCGKYSRASVYLLLAKELTHRRTQTLHKDSEDDVTPDISIAKNYLLEAVITEEHHNQFEDAKKLSEEAKKILNCIYQDSDEPRIAATYHSPNVKEPGRAFELFERISRDHRPDINASYKLLTKALDELDRPQESLDFKLKAVEILKRIFGESHNYIALIYVDIGSSFDELNRYHEAIQWKEKGLVILRKIFGENHPDVALTHSALGNTLVMLNCLDDAKNAFQDASESMRNVFVADHPLMATIYDNLGTSLKCLGEFQMAKDSHELALLINLKTLGKTHHNIPKSRNNFSATLIECGMYQQALGQLVQAQEQWIELCGDCNPTIMAIYNHMGLALSAINSHEKALDYQLRVLRLGQLLFGEKHPNLATSHENIGLTLNRLAQYTKAKEHQDRGRILWQEFFGDSHPDIAVSYNNEGTFLRAIGLCSESIEAHNTALSFRIRDLGENHPLVGTSYCNMAMAYCDLENYVEALALQEKGLALWIKAYGKDHSKVTNLQDLIIISQEMSKAVSQLEKKQYKALFASLKSLERSLKGQSSITIAQWSFLVAILSKQSEKIIRERLEFLTRFVDASKMQTIEVAKAQLVLAVYYMKKGDYAKTITYGNMLAKSDPLMLFNYNQITIEGLGESPAVKGERLPCFILGKYYALRAHEAATSKNGRTNGSSSTTSSSPTSYDALYSAKKSELVKLLDEGHWSGHKATQIRQSLV